MSVLNSFFIVSMFHRYLRFLLKHRCVTCHRSPKSSLEQSLLKCLKMYHRDVISCQLFLSGLYTIKVVVVAYSFLAYNINFYFQHISSLTFSKIFLLDVTQDLIICQYYPQSLTFIQLTCSSYQNKCHTIVIMTYKLCTSRAHIRPRLQLASWTLQLVRLKTLCGRRAWFYDYES